MTPAKRQQATERQRRHRERLRNGTRSYRIWANEVELEQLLIDAELLSPDDIANHRRVALALSDWLLLQYRA